MILCTTHNCTAVRFHFTSKCNGLTWNMKHWAKNTPNEWKWFSDGFFTCSWWFCGYRRRQRIALFCSLFDTHTHTTHAATMMDFNIVDFVCCFFSSFGRLFRSRLSVWFGSVVVYIIDFLLFFLSAVRWAELPSYDIKMDEENTNGEKKI